MDSQLRIEGMTFPPFSCRNAKQTITPITWGEFRRTVNGDLRYVGLDAFHKYKSVIECEDEVLPPFHQGWIGQDVCLHSLGTITEHHTVSVKNDLCLHRQAAELSVKCAYEIRSVEGNTVTFEGDMRGQTICLSYRPILHVKITKFAMKDHEWDNVSGWVLETEEV